MLKLVLFLGLYAMLSNGVASITNYYMDMRCDTKLTTYFSNQLRIRLTSGSFASGLTCRFTVQLPTNRFMLYFKDMKIFDPSVLHTCSSGWLDIRDGSSRYSSYLTGKQCGYSPPNQIYRSSGNAVTFLFNSGRSSHSSRAFDIIMTPYHTGGCYDDEYSCNNGRCIGDSNSCSVYNSCGDNSDCSTTISVGGIAGGIVGIVGIVGAVIFVTCFIIVCRRRRAAIVRQPVGVSSIQSTTVATDVAPPPYTAGYSQPPPQPYPQQMQATVQYPQQPMY